MAGGRHNRAVAAEQRAAAVVERTSDNLEVEALVLDAGTGYALHYHSKDQLAWMGSGAMSLSIGGSTWHLRREHFAWIPAGMLHEMAILAPRELINVYTDTRLRPAGARWSRPCALVVDRLAPALLWHLAEEPRSLSRRDLCHRLLVDVLESAETRDDVIALPTHDRARAVAKAILADPADPRDLAAFAAELGVSEKTLSRAFVAQTGSTFRRWRVAVRLNAAAGMLVDGQPVAAVADAVGYAATSAFIAAFAERFGCTPGRYAQVAAGQPPEVRADV
ncbi:helix-turn-helix domain-containing protein [Jiangella anatolica]|uniref:HTH-type transcriptional regulator RipA n=1 Tax=Jiangella anatolica TaxID=2670374 RepID=A0A2W2BFT3_9ACTN|nr:AraC family transcriptional regulator [Jiangella anatolica]PZF84842.1 AraC family transcriptional regulator [Jiangella anatolica]